MKGIIALDIDGTITNLHSDLQPEVKSFLKALSEEWIVVFITGRTFTWGYEVLQNLDFPYYLAVHNGAIVFHMPSKKIVLKKLVSTNSLPATDILFEDLADDYILYPESEGQPICFYRPSRFSTVLLSYLKGRAEVFQEKWIPVDDFKNLPFDDFFALKFFGSLEDSQKVAGRLENQDLHAPIIKDPYDRVHCKQSPHPIKHRQSPGVEGSEVTPYMNIGSLPILQPRELSRSFIGADIAYSVLDVYIVQATHRDVTKGSTLEQLKKLLLPHGITIAAGDDYNDASMLDFADIKVVMATAPEPLLQIAHVIAPPASEMGIIFGLTAAIKRITQNG